ncbi:MAG: flagellar biosynthetic protein FliO [Tepidisphaeraceae bacterium]
MKLRLLQVVFSVILLAACVPVSVRAQATTAPASVEQREFPRTFDRTIATRPPGSTTGNTGSTLDLPRVLAALAIVVALIFGLRWAARRFLGAGGTTTRNRNVRVLSRSPIAPRQQILLLQVGRRVIVTADCAGQLSTLANIEDPDEVAQLIGGYSAPVEENELIEPKSDDVASFEATLGNEQQKFDGDEATESQRSEINSLAERVKQLGQQLKRT